MGQSQSMCTEMNMSASPEIAQMITKKVQRHRGWHKPQITTNSEDGKIPEEMQVGDQIRIDMKKAVFNLTVVEQSADTEKQQFGFNHSAPATEGSVVAQKGSFKVSGMNAHLFGPGWNMNVQTRPKSEFVQDDLKPVTEKEMN
ncbi:hypothetical protein BX600DRAFT_438973 [Xylariales sp. PMI_506]|nr:hypothetical protein BX600DRAFT_438973 [Xylariales sp. PMI_506]